MDESLKQRLVGAAVLASLAVIFLPSLFQRNDGPARIDTDTLIPPAPVITPVIVNKPEKPKSITVPPASELFQPEILDEVDEVAAEPDADQPESPAATQPDESEKNASGVSYTETNVPKGWVIQVASFKSAESANTLVKRLQNQSFKAYTKPVKTKSGDFHRVFVGPYIDKSRAQQSQKQIDSDFKVKSRMVRYNPVSGD